MNQQTKDVTLDFDQIDYHTQQLVTTNVSVIRSINPFKYEWADFPDSVVIQLFSDIVDSAHSRKLREGMDINQYLGYHSVMETIDHYSMAAVRHAYKNQPKNVLDLITKLLK